MRPGGQELVVIVRGRGASPSVLLFQNRAQACDGGHADLGHWRRPKRLYVLLCEAPGNLGASGRERLCDTVLASVRKLSEEFGAIRRVTAQH